MGVEMGVSMTWKVLVPVYGRNAGCVYVCYLVSGTVCLCP